MAFGQRLESQRTSAHPSAGAQIINYSLLIAFLRRLAAALGTAMSGLPDDGCSLSDRLSRLMGEAPPAGLVAEAEIFERFRAIFFQLAKSLQS